MLPRSPALDASDGAARDSVSSGDVGVSVVARANVSDLFVRKLCAVMPVTTHRAILLYHVFGVFFARSCKQVGVAYARAVVAAVQNKGLARWQFTVSHLVRHDVCSQVLASLISDSVSVGQGASPQPARSEAGYVRRDWAVEIDVFPKSLRNRRADAVFFRPLPSPRSGRYSDQRVSVATPAPVVHCAPTALFDRLRAIIDAAFSVHDGHITTVRSRCLA